MYTCFAEVYDSLMSDAEYDKRFKVLKDLFIKYDRMPSLMLDLACGTGGFSRRFAGEGVSVIGVDISPDMLSVAQDKNDGFDVMYLCQDMTELDLYGTVDGAVCCMDSLNHLSSYGEFCTVLKKVSLFLERERLFIFDVNTPYKHKKVLANNIFIKETDNVYCVWQNEYERDKRSVEISLDFFVESEGIYLRKSEQFKEIAFKDSQVEHALKKAGFRIVDRLDGDTAGPVESKSERIIYVARKIK